MRKVIKSSEVFHFWANQTQSEGRVQNNSVYFEGKTIYSYGSHYQLGYHYNDNLVFINSTTYSVTTTGHQSASHRAVNHKTSLAVPVVNPYSMYCHESNMEYFIDIMKNSAEKYPRARTNKEWLLSDFNRAQTNLNFYVKAVKIKSKIKTAFKKWLTVEFSDVAKVTSEQLKKDIAIRLKQQKEAEKKRAAQLIIDQIKFDENLELWRVHEYKTSRYLSNPSDYSKYYLRESLDGQTVQTSGGVSVPIDAAKILFDRILKGKDIKGFKIGSFTVISINGVLTVGCHNIERDEITAFAKSMNWI